MDENKWNVFKRHWGEWSVFPPNQLAAGTFPTWREAFNFANTQVLVAELHDAVNDLVGYVEATAENVVNTTHAGNVIND
jgi:hypothetical protein